ncbi:hypothetical protein Cgig2_014572 [Carnegiea gigantea]|uniref:SHSP domain-containing protein n=1 Tax=Carnegiea gigantea TaxID=171969 RepID=A0A9Q1L013_9CARY|nr:hypothetical protein Cgig2_014572 [Carnegiea gigantea]
MALARVALKNLRQRASQSAPAACKNYLLVPHFNGNYAAGAQVEGLGVAQGQGKSYSMLQNFASKSSSSSSSSSEGKEAGTRSDRSRWRSLLPRRLRQPSLWRRDTRDPFVPDDNDTPLQPIVVKIKETDDSYKVMYDVPGLTKDELKVTVADGVLRVQGERKVEDEDEAKEDEDSVSYGYVNSSIVLPDDAKVEDIKAELKDGVLAITIPKTESHAKGVKEVKIN